MATLTFTHLLSSEVKPDHRLTPSNNKYLRTYKKDNCSVNYSHYIRASNEKHNPVTEFLIKQSTTPCKTGRKCDFNSEK